MFKMNEIQHFVWDANPILINLGFLQLRWYGLLFASGLALGYWLLSKVFKAEGENVEKLDTFLLYFIGGTILGARLGHVFFYDWSFYKAHPLEIIMIQHGGLASHGAAIGILLFTWLFVHFHFKGKFSWLLDRMAIFVPLGGAFIRLGNFVNSEILGKASDLPWAVIFSRVDNIPRHPVQLYEAIAYLLIFALLYFYLYNKEAIRKRKGELSGWFFVLVFGFRFFIEFLKIHQSDLVHSQQVLDMGQILSIPLVLLGIFLIFWSRKKDVILNKKPKLK